MKLDLTILIPCLNEEETVGMTVKIAKKFISDNNINGEVLVVDNASDDNSNKIALENGARVVVEQNRGYGSALICGTKNALGKYIIMGDADGSYDFSDLNPFLEKLNDGYDLVVGNRFRIDMEENAMSFSHRYIGNPILSFIGKKLYRLNVGDFHCGLRGYNREKILDLDLNSPGMEYASEMIIKAKLKNLKITEIPIKLYKDKRVNSKSHLNTFRDGIRHLVVLFKCKKDSIK